MGTVNKEIADDVVAGKYDSDKPLLITEYTNAWGETSYGVVFEGERLDRYHESEFVINPKLYWSKDGTHK